MHPMLNIAIQAARSAGKIIVLYLDKLDITEINSDARHNFVAKAAQTAEEEIIETIRKRFPSHSILARTSGHQAGDRYCWIIDPLNGTTNFAHGLPIFSISLALQVNGKLEIGVIYDPLRNEIFTAERGKGAQLNNRRIRMSHCKTVDQALLGTSSQCHHTPAHTTHLNTLTTLLTAGAGIRPLGSVALDLAYTACGRLDGTWQMHLKPWELAAGALLIAEAGGIISGLANENNYLDSGNIVSAAPKLHKLLLEVLQKTSNAL